MRRVGGLLLVLGVAGFGALALAQGSADDGLIGPANRIQPSGRKLAPAGQAHAGRQPSGRRRAHAERPLLWTLSAGRGRNDVRIVRVAPAQAVQEAGARRERAAQARLQAVREEVRRSVGRVVQTIPMPGLSGGIAMAPDGRTAYVSGVAGVARTRTSRRPAGTPGKEGDVIHVLPLRPAHGPGERGRARSRCRRPATRRSRRASRRPRRRRGPGRATSPCRATARRCSPRSTWPTTRRSSTPRRGQVALREGRQLPVRRGDHARRQVRARLERVRRHGVGDRPRLRPRR